MLWGGSDGTSLFLGGDEPRSATGLTQLGARAYDAGLGRFISVDPLLDTSAPRRANAYAYSYNSPVSHYDPTGLIPAIQHDGGKLGTWKPSAKTTTAPPAAGQPTSNQPSSYGPAYAASGYGSSDNPCGTLDRSSAEQQAMSKAAPHGTLTLARSERTSLRQPPMPPWLRAEPKVLRRSCA
ncbi:RHS repeat-associated core domain-containing protein [Microbacterium sp. RU33B]|uniref:RHS repeat-associated core domain-containing protein n=1 Tax=Microbacterium sp. RU33B TaxID=1907390 RepID=UPI0009789E2B